MKTFGAICSIALAGLFVLAAAKAVQAEADVVKGCEGLSSAIKNEFSVPYKPVKGRLSVSCVKDVSVTLKTMHFFVAAAFYHDDKELREKSIKKLNNYKCPSKKSCEELSTLVDTHAKATIQAQPDAWTELEPDVSELKDSLRAKVAASE